MAQNEHIQQELQNIAPHLIELNSNVYVTPRDYFNTLSTNILQVINNEAAIISLPVKQFQIPANYFENLPNQILAKIRMQENEIFAELETVAPILNSISKQMPYKLPADYFENLSIAMPQQNAKVVSMYQPLKFAKYLVAACMIGLLVSGGYTFLNKKSIKENHKVATNTNVFKSLESLPAKELEKGIETTAPFIIQNEVAFNSTPNELPTVQESLDYIPTDALETYLNQNDNNSFEEIGMN